MTGDAPPAFEVRRVRKTYRQGKVVVEALSGVDLVIRAGEFVVVAGILGQREEHAAAPARRA